jgi:AhpD family alkylhydroperoxidase
MSNQAQQTHADGGKASDASPLATRPDLAAAMTCFKAALRADRRLPDRLVELMRLRVAYRNQCRPCMSMRYAEALSDGLTEQLVCSLERPADAADLTAAEKAAVGYADQFAVNHLSIATQLASLRLHFKPAEIAEIAWWAAFFVGFGRLAAVFDDGMALPVGERHQDGTPLTPWRIKDPIVVS